MTLQSEHRLPAFARHRAPHPAVRSPGPDAEHPAARRPGRAVPPGVLAPRRSAPRSRAALLTGEYSHTNGMLGLAHRGYRLADYDHHLVHTLRAAGYTSDADRRAAPVAPTRATSATTTIVEIDARTRPRSRPAAARDPAREPDGAVLPQRRLLRDPPRLLRADLGARRAVLAAAREPARHARDAARHGGLQGQRARAGPGRRHACSTRSSDDNTLVIFTTDHGLAFPGAKATLTDRGIGVLLIMRGPGGFTRRQGLRRARLPDRHLPDDLRAARHRARRTWLRGPLAARTPRRNDAVFAEITFHAAYEPQRAVRTKRYKYIRRFDNGHEDPCSPNIDDSPSKDYLLAHGLAERDAAAGGAATTSSSTRTRRTTSSTIRRTRRSRPSCARGCRRWMEETGDPLLRRAGRARAGHGDQHRRTSARRPSRR